MVRTKADAEYETADSSANKSRRILMLAVCSSCNNVHKVIRARTGRISHRPEEEYVICGNNGKALRIYTFKLLDIPYTLHTARKEGLSLFLSQNMERAFVSCVLCRKALRSFRALSGHLRVQHGVEKGWAK